MLISSVISAKGNENRPSLISSFAQKIEIPARGLLCLRILLGVFLFVFWAGSLPDLHYRVWGSVRLFLFLDIASCAGTYFPRPPCSCSILPTAFIFPQPELHSSGTFLHRSRPNGQKITTIFPTERKTKMSKVYCKYCGASYNDVRTLTSNNCMRHPDGTYKGKHSPAL